MIKNNSFYIPNLKNIVIIGNHVKLYEIEKFFIKNKFKYSLVTSKDQSKAINGAKYNIFNKIDDKFKRFILDKYKIDETLFISLGSRIIFKEEIINNFFKNNLVNFHNSRLPLDAGGGGMTWRILRRDRIDNQLVHLVDKGVDTGPILSSQKSIFPASLTIPLEMENFSSSQFLTFFKDFILKIKKGKKFNLKLQLDYIGRYNPRINTKINGWIDWNMSSENLIRFINAFDDPYSGAQTMINNKIVSIKKAQLHDGESPNHPFMTGLISRNDREWIVVSTTDNAMLLIEKVLDTKNNNIVSKLKAGERFITPKAKLFLAKSKRVKYNSKGLIKKK